MLVSYVFIRFHLRKYAEYQSFLFMGGSKNYHRTHQSSIS